MKFVYGETGWAGGGRFKPHRTHQNGTSVDFMVPVRNDAGASVPLPRGYGDRYGYDLEFDASGHLLTFMAAKPWIRHDEHYHVDFAVPCKALTKP